MGLVVFVPSNGIFVGQVRHGANHARERYFSSSLPLEGIPKVTLEAAATGLPCVIFRDYATPSVVDGETGFQVGTLEELMIAVGRLIADRSLRCLGRVLPPRHADEVRTLAYRLDAAQRRNSSNLGTVHVHPEHL